MTWVNTVSSGTTGGNLLIFRTVSKISSLLLRLRDDVSDVDDEDEEDRDEIRDLDVEADDEGDGGDDSTRFRLKLLI